ncbi:unnamed protein product [Zymoseptoria tritici ST99CH_1E4]|uniref:Uncharacterized protein n=1 Tax=Zymoseptoria tritici ST99CH_1E4 TaxID=1276532 RepID=A0A2H1H9R3_ZYMTR|nr:unnamed protein product [Zymoseptoria tritici ST99CH_1E4]
MVGKHILFIVVFWSAVRLWMAFPSSPDVILGQFARLPLGLKDVKMWANDQSASRWAEFRTASVVLVLVPLAYLLCCLSRCLGLLWGCAHPPPPLSEPATNTCSQEPATNTCSQEPAAIVPQLDSAGHPESAELLHDKEVSYWAHIESVEEQSRLKDYDLAACKDELSVTQYRLEALSSAVSDLDATSEDYASLNQSLQVSRLPKLIDQEETEITVDTTRTSVEEASRHGFGGREFRCQEDAGTQVDMIKESSEKAELRVQEVEAENRALHERLLQQRTAIEKAEDAAAHISPDELAICQHAMHKDQELIKHLESEEQRLKAEVDAPKDDAASAFGERTSLSAQLKSFEEELDASKCDLVVAKQQRDDVQLRIDALKDSSDQLLSNATRNSQQGRFEQEQHLQSVMGSLSDVEARYAEQEIALKRAVSACNSLKVKYLEATSKWKDAEEKSKHFAQSLASLVCIIAPYLIAVPAHIFSI